MARPDNITTLYVVLTARCNLQCAYCFENDKKARSMSWSTIRRSVDLALASKRKCVRLVFYGGEPLLNFDQMGRAVAYANRNRPRDKDIQFGLVTNGTLLNRDVAAFLEEHWVETQLSFDGVSASQSLRGTGTFAKLDRILDRLRTEHAMFYRKRLRISVTVLPATLDHLADSVAYFVEKGVQRIEFNPVITSVAGWDDDCRDRLDHQFSRILRLSVDHYRRIGEIPLHLFQSTSTDEEMIPASRTMCGVMRGETPVVDVDGQVHGCVMFADSFQTFRRKSVRDAVSRMRIGDPRDREFRQRYARFPRSVKQAGMFHDQQNKRSSYGACRNCRYLCDCSICPMSIGNLPETHDVDRVPDFLCAFNLVSLSYRDRFAARVERELTDFRLSTKGRKARSGSRRLRSAAGF